MSVHKLQEELLKANFSTASPAGSPVKLFYNEQKTGYMLGWGDTLPSSAAGWSKGAIFILTDGGSVDLLLYLNEGDSDSSTFTAVKASAG